jgi:hypothetical protein
LDARLTVGLVAVRLEKEPPRGSSTMPAVPSPLVFFTDDAGHAFPARLLH